MTMSYNMSEMLMYIKYRSKLFHSLHYIIYILQKLYDKINKSDKKNKFLTDMRSYNDYPN